MWCKKVGIEGPGGHIPMAPWTPQPVGMGMAKMHQSSTLQNPGKGQGPLLPQAKGGTESLDSPSVSSGAINRQVGVRSHRKSKRKETWQLQERCKF